MNVLELIEPLKVAVFKIHEVNLMIKYLQFYNYDRTKHLPYIVLYELSAECNIVKLSAYSIRDDNRKIPIDCGKCHVKHDVTVLLT